MPFWRYLYRLPRNFNYDCLVGRIVMKYLSIKKLLYRVNCLLNKWRYSSFLNAPGMMGYDERMNLFKTCKNELTGKGVAVEFGAFFGASTSAIQHGLRTVNTGQSDSELHVVDCFRSALTSDFTKHVRALASTGKVDHLLKEDDGWLCFYQAFLANINANDPNIKIHRCFLSDLVWVSKPVEFLHLDMPKDWKLAYPIASTIFPDLIVGAKVLFQDFGYQWSAELIALVGGLVSMGLIRPYRLTDTTLSVVVLKPISTNAIVSLNKLMGSPEDVITAIETARGACRELTSSSIDATISMAKAQYQYAHGNVDDCFNIISSILLEPLCGSVTRERLADLFLKGFVADKSYEKVDELGEF